MATSIHSAYLLTGGNLGDREMHLSEARALINEDCGRIVKTSSIYETAAWGKSDQPAFLNQALEVETALSARQLLRQLLKIEKSIGRVREEKFGPRIIDIDILLYDDEIHRYELLRLPHPELANRRFALTPLQEIAPQLLHPVLHKTISELLLDCKDELAVTKTALRSEGR